MSQSAETTVDPPVEKQEKYLAEESVKMKIKHMIVDILNAGSPDDVCTLSMVRNDKTFDDLNMTKYEKRRLVFQCDEYYGINLKPAAEGTRNIGDFITMVYNEVQLKHKPENSTQTEQETTAAEQE